MSKLCNFCGEEYFGSPTAHVEVCTVPRGPVELQINVDALLAPSADVLTPELLKRAFENGARQQSMLAKEYDLRDEIERQMALQGNPAMHPKHPEWGRVTGYLDGCGAPTLEHLEVKTHGCIDAVICARCGGRHCPHWIAVDWCPVQKVSIS